jgi:hypothetical protein
MRNVEFGFSSVVRATFLIAAFLMGPASLTAPWWVQFEDETASRLSAPPSNGTLDPDVKSYAWGDLDGDGDSDLVVARMAATGTAQRRTNVLLMNEGGVLVDRTWEYAGISDVPGDQGFLTPTRDEDVQVVDVDLDGRLDVVTAVRDGGVPAHLGYPRVYVNLGADETTGQWLGLRFESHRIPELLNADGNPGFLPRFVSIATGDATGDGYPDLWFGDYQATPTSLDFNDRLLVNMGAANPGVFVDETQARILGGISELDGQPFDDSYHWSSSAAIADLNGDGTNEILRINTLLDNFVAAAYSVPGSPGMFDTYDLPVLGQSAYHMSVGDLNQDSRLDLVVQNSYIDNDRYLLNLGDGALPTFTHALFRFAHDGSGAASSDEGEGGETLIADLDGDGWNDVLIADVHLHDPDLCTQRRMHIYRNLQGTVGGDVILEEQTRGSNCYAAANNPPECIVASIPADRLTGVHDVAVFDLTGDGFNEMIVGRCGGTEIWVNVPPAPAGSVPDGADVAGVPLELGKGLFGRLSLQWGNACIPSDYAIYEGTLGDFASHAYLQCSTGGATTENVTPSADSSYYLVVPTSGGAEGSYGRASDGTPRAQGAAACLPMRAGACDP